jgi:hypothetical protein
MQVDDASLQLEKNPDAFWKSFFSSGSVYKQAYMQEIIEALMSDGTDLTNRVFFNCFQDPTFHYNEAVVPKVRQRPVNQDNKELKENWTTKFLENGGLTYVVNRFMKLRDSLDISDKFKKQEIKFTITVLRRFLASAFHA